MLTSILTTLSLALAATTVNADTWSVTDFSIASRESNPTIYHLKVTGEGQTNADCLATNAVPSTHCPNTNGPAPFNSTLCCPQVGRGRGTGGFSWSLVQTVSPVLNGGEAFYVELTHAGPGAEVQKPKIACSPLFNASSYSCLTPPCAGEVLNVPKAFNVTVLPAGQQCIYA